MDELKELFGDGSLTYEDFTAKVAEKGYKLADLSKGGYVSKEKASREQARLQAEYDAYKAANDASQYADYDAIKTERDKLLAEKKESEMNAILADAGVDEKFRRFVASEVSARVTDKKDFKKCLEEYITENPQFATSQGTSVFFRRTQPPLQGGGEGQTENQKMNEIIRSKAK